MVLALGIAVLVFCLVKRRKQKRMQNQNTVVHPRGDSGSDPELGKIVGNYRAAVANDGTMTNYSGPSEIQVCDNRV